MEKLIRVIVFISLVLCSSVVMAEEKETVEEDPVVAEKVSYEKISCLVGESIMFLTVPMDSNWDILQMEDAAKTVCLSMVLVRIIPGQVVDAEEE
jgi:hypothetical protein